MTSGRLPRILQFGVSGQLGRELIRLAKHDGIPLQALTSEEANFTRPATVVQAVEQASSIDVVVNAAAYTAVDRAEKEEGLATIVNAETVAILAKACASRGIPLVHVSTDYVYDGEKPEPYIESDPTHPLSVYGRSKLAGESAIRESGARHVILRTSWVYSPFGTNFVKTMLRLGSEREELRIVADQVGAPTAASDLAITILSIARQLANSPKSTQFGTFHYSGADFTTWYEFALAIMGDAYDWAGTHARVVPITTAEYPTAAHRPRNSRLDNSKIRRTFEIVPISWREALGRVLLELRAQKEHVS